MTGSYLVSIGMIMIFSGFLLIFVAGFFGAGGSKGDNGHDHPHSSSGEFSTPSYNAADGRDPVSMENRNEVRGGGIIMLGPIPIIIGSDNKSAKGLMILAIVLMLLYFLLF